jgi:hypothetical protein
MTRAQRIVLTIMTGSAVMLAVGIIAALTVFNAGSSDRRPTIQLRTATAVPVGVTQRPTAVPTVISVLPQPPTPPAPARPPAASPSPEPFPSPTRTPTPTPSLSPVPSRTPSPTPPASPTPVPGRALPDLVLQDFGVATTGAGTGFVRVDISNVGQGDVTARPIEIIGIDQTGTEVLHLTTGPLTIPTGAVVTVTTGYKPVARTVLTVVINPNNAIAEADAPPGFQDPNNAITKTVNPLPGR